MSKYSHINFKPPQSVRDEFKQALDIDPKLRGSGLESATVAMAGKIARGETISPEQARKGYRFWSRNERFLKEDKDSAAWVSAKFWGGRSGMSWYRKLYKQIEATDSATNSLATNVIKCEDGKYFVYSEKGKRLSKGYDTKEQAEERLKQVERFKHMNNHLVIHTNTAKAKVTKENGRYVIRGVPYTVDDIAMNRTLYPADYNAAAANEYVGHKLTMGHPKDEQGKNVSAYSKDGVDYILPSKITQTYNKDGVWYFNAYIEEDELRAKRGDGNLSGSYFADRLDRGLPVGVSTGLFFETNDVSGVDKAGNEYDQVAINQVPNHIALLHENERPAGGDATMLITNSEGLELAVNLDEYISEERGLIERLLTALQGGKKEVYNNLDNINVNEESEMDAKEILAMFNGAMKPMQEQMNEYMKGMNARMDKMEETMNAMKKPMENMEQKVNSMSETFETNAASKLDDIKKRAKSAGMAEFMVNKLTVEDEAEVAKLEAESGKMVVNNAGGGIPGASYGQGESKIKDPEF